MGTQAKRLTATTLVVTALLDSGGSYDYAANACDYEDGHTVHLAGPAFADPSRWPPRHFLYAK